MRVVPFENEDVNECWIADRDRFSYEALNGPDRLTKPMLKQGGQWKEVDWQTALEYVANGLRGVQSEHGAQSIGALVSPHSTLEELHLATLLVRGLGSDNIDYRLRNAEFPASEGVRWLGMPIAALSTLQSVLVVGSNLRKEHPLFAQRIRQAARKGCAVSALNSAAYDWAMPMAQSIVAPAGEWAAALADIAAAVAQERGVAAPVASGRATDAALAVARSLASGEGRAVLLGNAAAHHAQASSLLALAQWIGAQTGAVVGYLTEAANTVGAQFVGAQPRQGGLDAGRMLAGGLKAALLLNTEPVHDSAAGARAAEALAQAEMVVTLSPFKTNLEFSDVLLPIAPFTETSGSFVNAEGRLQGFHAVVKPLGDARPAWKVLRVLGNLLGVQGIGFETSQEVLAHAVGATGAELPTHLPAARLSNTTSAAAAVPAIAAGATEPVVAAIYQLDSLVRRAPSLQLTADGRQAAAGAPAAVEGAAA